jgi:hypothetical protein
VYVCVSVCVCVCACVRACVEVSLALRRRHTTNLYLLPGLGHNACTSDALSVRHIASSERDHRTFKSQSHCFDCFDYLYVRSVRLKKKYVLYRRAIISHWCFQTYSADEIIHSTKHSMKVCAISTWQADFGANGVLCIDKSRDDALSAS